MSPHFPAFFRNKLDSLFGCMTTYYEIAIIAGVITCYTNEGIKWGKLFVDAHHMEKNNYSDHVWIANGFKVELYFNYMSYTEVPSENVLKDILLDIYGINTEDVTEFNFQGIYFV